MTTKEKYNNALERAKEIYNTAHNPSDAAILNKRLTEIFPELKESEDEKIRKKVIEVLKLNIRGAETQMQASRGVDRCFEIYACNKVIAWLEKQGEQKLQDKVEPKFKVGDWIVDRCGNAVLIAHIDEEDKRYMFEIGCYTHKPINWEYIEEVDKNYHLWTIQDAKDGDVLYVSTEEKCFYAIFQNYENYVVYFHCYLCKDFSVGGNKSIGKIENIHPLQYQHIEKFHQRMKEAGYEWDAEKKELRKIETSKQLNADEVIKWLNNNIFDDIDEGHFWSNNRDIVNLIEQFKQDFEI